MDKMCTQILIHKTFGRWLLWRQRRQNSRLSEKGHNGRHAGNLTISDSPSYCVQLATALDPWILWGHNGLRTRYAEIFLYIQFSRIKISVALSAPKVTDIKLEILTIILGIPSQGSRNTFQLNDFMDFFNHMYWNIIHYISGTGSVSVFWLAST
jgi:hypothetical protein